MNRNKNANFVIRKLLLLVISVAVFVGLAACGRNSGQTNDAADGLDTNNARANEPEPYYSTFSFELVVGDVVLTVVEYNFYFNEMKFEKYQYYFMRTNEEPFDPFRSLEGQMFFDGIQTWADYIHNAVAELMMQYAKAVESGTQLGFSEFLILEDFDNMLHELAEEDGVTVDELIGDVLPGMTFELYMRYIERDMLIHLWRTELIQSIVFSREEMEAFYYENWREIDPLNEGVRDTSIVTVDARHILIMFPDGATSAEMDEVRQAAQEIYTEWQNGEATEDSFAALATERSDDTDSLHRGGLYENIWRGEMPPSFDAWIFDPIRSFGDTEIIETSFGVHIMFFVQGSGEEWLEVTEPAMLQIAFEEIIDGLSERFTVERRAV
ncbi:MAG: peptidylprolyl isomerase [Firmicutes bacterium]|nr:peptidylprolyl isomerase [Bacillota bacterium]